MLCSVIVFRILFGGTAAQQNFLAFVVGGCEQFFSVASSKVCSKWGLHDEA
jgi:hypothetical protein